MRQTLFSHPEQHSRNSVTPSFFCHPSFSVTPSFLGKGLGVRCELREKKDSRVRSICTEELCRRSLTQTHASIFEQVEILLGPDLTASLLRQLGGRKIYIRIHPAEGDHDAITDAIGLAAAGTLSKAFGGSWVTLPVGRTLEWRRGRSERQARILEMFDQGAHPGEIASTLQCSERYVYKVLNGK